MAEMLPANSPMAPTACANERMRVVASLPISTAAWTTPVEIGGLHRDLADRRRQLLGGGRGRLGAAQRLLGSAVGSAALVGVGGIAGQHHHPPHDALGRGADQRLDLIAHLHQRPALRHAGGDAVGLLLGAQAQRLQRWP